MPAIPSASAIARHASIHRGVDSLSMMPIKHGLNFGGRVLERLGMRSPNSGRAGDNLIKKYIIEPSETVNNSVGKALGEIPGLNWFFKHKLRPGDVSDATRAGLKMDNATFRRLSTQAHDGDLFTHRLSAPLESKGMYRLVLPALSGMYVQDQWNKEKTPEQVARDKRNNENKGIFDSLMSSGSNVKTGGIGMSSLNNANGSREDLMTKAANEIDRLTALLKEANIKSESANAELAFYKQASSLVKEGSMSSEYIEDYVDEGLAKLGQARRNTSASSHTKMASGGGLQGLYQESNSYIPKHAESTMMIHSPHRGSGDGRSGGSGARSVSGSAREALDSFILG